MASATIGSDHKILPFRFRFLYGIVGGVIATLIQYVGAIVFGLPFPPEEIFRIILAPVPGSVQSVAVENLGEYAKYSAFTAAIVAYVLLYGLIASIVTARSRGLTVSKPCTVLLMSIPTILALAFEWQLAASYSSLSSMLGWFVTISVVLFGNLTFTGSFLKLTNERQVMISRSIESPSIPRRGFLWKAAALVVVAAATVIGAKVALSLFFNQPIVANNPIPLNPETSTTTSMLNSVSLTSSSTATATSSAALAPVFLDPRISDLLDSEVTDNRVFYRVDIDPSAPQLDFDSWSLTIRGKVTNPFTIDKTSLLAMPTVDEYVTLECVSNTIIPPGGLIGNAKWTGVSLATLLNQAGPTPEAKYVVFQSADGYEVGIPLDRALNHETMLAYKMNDNYLPPEHGAPVRAIVPGIYGMMNAKWITGIMLVDYIYMGYWQTRGWSNDAKIKTTSIIYYPTNQAAEGGISVGSEGYVPVAGVAFAGDRGISKVEVSTDGGKTWNQASLKPPTSNYSWVLWAYEWNPSGKGEYQLIVRATDGTGALQTIQGTDPYPDGAAGYAGLIVNIT